MTKENIVFDDTKHITVAKTADLLGKTEHCVRQLILRKKITSYSFNNHTFLDLDSVLTYFSRKKGLPSWDANVQKIKQKSFVAIEFAAQELMVQVSYVIKLIKQKALEGYITSSGEILITKESINRYLGAGSKNATHEL